MDTFLVEIYCIKSDYQKTKAIEDLLKRLTKKQRIVIIHRFGIDCDECTLACVGNMLNLSPERIRQIQITALRKLRLPKINKDVDFLFNS